MLKISFAGCLDLSPVILTQFCLIFIQNFVTFCRNSKTI